MGSPCPGQSCVSTVGSLSDVIVWAFLAATTLVAWAQTGLSACALPETQLVFPWRVWLGAGSSTYASVSPCCSPTWSTPSPFPKPERQERSRSGSWWGVCGCSTYCGGPRMRTRAPEEGGKRGRVFQEEKPLWLAVPRLRVGRWVGTHRTLNDVCSRRWSPACTLGEGTLLSSDAATTHQQPQSHSASHAAFCPKNIENAMVTKGSHILERPGRDKS